MIKKLNKFVIIILLFEFVSLISGYGTHYSHPSHALMLGIISINVLLLRKETLLKLVKIKINRE